MSSPVQLVLDDSVRRRIPRAWLGALERSVRRVLRGAAGPRATVELRVCDDTAMAELHASTFGERHPTDVLSFPAGPARPGPGPSSASLGAIVINWDAVTRQAPRRDGTGLLEEAASLCVHSIAHLLGHDHARRSEARRMLAAERRLGRFIGLHLRRPYGGGA